AARTQAVRSCRSTWQSPPRSGRPTSVSSSGEHGRKNVARVPPTEPVHVLVVDDDRNVQRMLADALTRHGFRVTVERDGESALAAFEGQSFDVVLLDVLLPAVNGYEVARRIKSTPRGERTPVLMLSGVYKTKMHQAQAVERHGAAGFVEKPFKLNQLFGKLEGVLGDRFPLGSAGGSGQRGSGAGLRAAG